jgi:hypothetical protein
VAPSATNCLATVDLPEAIPPVSAISIDIRIKKKRECRWHSLLSKWFLLLVFA